MELLILLGLVMWTTSALVTRAFFRFRVAYRLTIEHAEANHCFICDQERDNLSHEWVEHNIFDVSKEAVHYSWTWRRELTTLLFLVLGPIGFFAVLSFTDEGERPHPPPMRFYF